MFSFVSSNLLINAFFLNLFKFIYFTFFFFLNLTLLNKKKKELKTKVNKKASLKDHKDLLMFRTFQNNLQYREIQHTDTLNVL